MMGDGNSGLLGAGVFFIFALYFVVIFEDYSGGGPTSLMHGPLTGEHVNLLLVRYGPP